MKTPDTDSIEHWIASSKDAIARKQMHIDTSWNKEQDLPVHSAYHSFGMDYADLGNAYFLRGDAVAEVREAYSQAGQHVLQAFTMAYDPTDPLYVGDKLKRPDQIDAGYGQVDWPSVSETFAIDGMNWSLMGKDFETARHLAHWYQDRPDGYKMEAVVNRYVYAYKYTLLGEPDQALPLLQTNLDHYQAKPPKHIGHRNYHRLSSIMMAIVQKDANTLNRHLLDYLSFYKKSIIPAEDYWDTSDEFICSAAVALANLAIDSDLAITATHDLLPFGLLQ